MYTTVYPTNIVTRTSLPVYVDDVDDVEAAVVNDPITELVAMQSEMGSLPKGTHASVKARLVACEMLSVARAYYAGSGQSITTGTWTKVALKYESYDALGEFDSTTNYRFTATKEGYYQVNAQCYMLFTTTSKYLQLALYKNGAAVVINRVAVACATQQSGHLADIIHLDVDDYLELYIYHNQGSSRNNFGASDKTFMSIHQLSAT